MSVANPATTALIGGSSLLDTPFLRNAPRRSVSTPHGTVTLLQRDDLVFLQRHGLHHYTPPHKINHRANLYALHLSGVTRILSVGSVGSMRRAISPGTLLLPDDFFAPHLSISFYDDHRGHQAPVFHPQWRQELLELWEKLDLPTPITSGCYWQTIGPRFETPTEIRVFQSHVHVVGMTLASECILAGELGIPYAAICVVDNYANGVSNEEISYDRFKARVRENEEMILHTLETLLQALSS